MDGLERAERAAVEQRWLNEGHDSTAFDAIPIYDRDRLLKTVRDREAQVERHVLHNMLDRSLSEGGFYSRRHQRFVLLVVAGIIGIMGIIAALADLFGRLFHR